MHYVKNNVRITLCVCWTPSIHIIIQWLPIRRIGYFITAFIIIFLNLTLDRKRRFGVCVHYIHILSPVRAYYRGKHLSNNRNNIYNNIYNYSIIEYILIRYINSTTDIDSSMCTVSMYTHLFTVKFRLCGCWCQGGIVVKTCGKTWRKYTRRPYVERILHLPDNSFGKIVPPAVRMWEMITNIENHPSHEGHPWWPPHLRSRYSANH